MRLFLVLALSAIYAAWHFSYIDGSDLDAVREILRPADDSHRPERPGASRTRDGEAEGGDHENGARVPPRGLLRVGTWNLRRLGHGSKRVDLVAQVIEESFDVLALQEVMDKEAVRALLDRLPGWRAEISARAVGRGTYAEFYAVLYREEYVVAERSFMLKDPGDRMMREPFVACMRAAAFDFCLVTVHIVFGDGVRERDQEIDALGRMLGKHRDGSREKDWLLVGDFNRMPGAPGFESVHRAGWRFARQKRVATSLGKRSYASAYDHILIDGRHTRELVRESVRVDLVARVCDGDFGMCKNLVSDHAPVVARFQVDGRDDD